MKRLLVIGVLTFVVGASSPSAIAVKTKPTATPVAKPLTATAYVAVNLNDDGAVLLGQNVHMRMAPASLTKIVTALVVRDEYSLDDIVTVSNVVNEVSGSAAGLRPGMRFTVRELLYMLMLPSANDAAMALAAHHPAGFEHFIQLMNQKARALGAFDSQFRTPHGLDKPGHYSSAWDMAIFARALLADPVLASVVNTRHYALRWPKGPALMLINHNHLLQRDSRVFGVKTGFTNLAGNSLVCAAHTSIGDILTVVLHSNDMYGDTQSLWAHGRARTLGLESGGGGIPGATVLPLPPKAPVQALPHVPKVPTHDPRDDVRWGVLMIALAVLTVLTLTAHRRRDPLREAADVHGWLEPLVSTKRG
jgi:D-alanyl-D-alanine carboxypeptidase (penicillin-binding protein 5/6)